MFDSSRTEVLGFNMAGPLPTSAIQPVVDELRALLQSVDQQLTDRLRSQLAPAYAAVCQEANQRLRRCDELLAKGLRSEALHLAQAEPVLLDLVAILDFPELAQYEQLCLMYGLPAPPKLQMETATALNEAYADDQPLEELMRKHRMLALGRGPLGARLALLRRIRELDGRNASLWEDDIRTFERARFQQMFNNVDQLIQRNSIGALTAASEELARSKWLVAPPNALVNKINGAVRRIGQSRSLSGLQTLEVKLYEAMSAFDVPTAVTLRKQWNSLLETAALPPTDPLAQRAAVVFLWIDEQFRRKADETSYQVASAALQTALDEGQPRRDLEKHAHNLLNFGRGMPELLEQRYQARLQEFESRGRRRRWALILIPAACLLLAAGATGFVLHRQAEADKVATAVGALEQMLDAEQIAEAKVFLKKLSETDPKTAGNWKVLEVQSKIQARDKDSEDRKQRFAATLKDAEAADLDAAGEELVNRARNMARSPDELSQVQRIVNLRHERRNKLTVARDNEVVPKLREVRERIALLEKLVSGGTDATKAADMLGEHELAVARLKNDAKGASDQIGKDIAGLAERLELLRTTLESKNLEGTLLAALTQSLGNRDDFGPFVKAAERYLKEFPNRELSQGLKVAVGERDQWSSVLECAALMKNVGPRPFSVSVKNAKTQAEAVRAFLAKHPAYPDAPVLDAYAKCLEAVAQRSEADPKSAVTEFRAIFGDQLVKELWFVKMDNGKVFYSRQDLVKLMKTSGDGFLRFQYVVGYNTKDKQALRNKLDVVGRGVAPQSVIAEEVKALPENFAEKDWEGTVIKVAQKVRDDSDMDPILKTVLLRRLLNCAVKGSLPLQATLADFRERMDNRGFEIDVAWADPDSKDAAEIRPKAKEFIAKFPSLAPALKAAQEAQQKIEADVAKMYRVPSGWLACGGEGRWEARLPAGVDLTGLAELYVLVPAADGPAGWRRIGKVERGKMVLDTTKADGLMEGRVVFATRASTAK